MGRVPTVIARFVLNPQLGPAVVDRRQNDRLLPSFGPRASDRRRNGRPSPGWEGFISETSDPMGVCSGPVLTLFASAVNDSADMRRLGFSGSEELPRTSEFLGESNQNPWILMDFFLDGAVSNVRVRFP